MSNKLVSLEKFTTLAASFLIDAQRLAEQLRHDRVCLEHLCVIVRSRIVADETLKQFGNSSTINKSIVEKFFALSSEKEESKMLAALPKALVPQNACWTVDLLSLYDFLAVNEKITSTLLLTELLSILEKKANEKEARIKKKATQMVMELAAIEKEFESNGKSTAPTWFWWLAYCAITGLAVGTFFLARR